MRTAHSSWGAGVPPTCPSDQATLLDQSPWTKPSLLNRWPLALEASQTVSPSPALPSLPSPPLPCSPLPCPPLRPPLHILE